MTQNPQIKKLFDEALPQIRAHAQAMQANGEFIDTELSRTKLKG